MAVNIIECLCNGESKEFVKITRAKYEQLLECNNFLEALQASGVDNWEGYEAAQEMIAAAPCACNPAAKAGARR